VPWTATANVSGASADGAEVLSVELAEWYEKPLSSDDFPVPGAGTHDYSMWVPIALLWLHPARNVAGPDSCWPV
jgi:hypothetical protein